MESRDGSGATAPGSDELLRLVFDSAVDYAIFSTDPLGRVTSWNVGAERLLGYSEEEIMGEMSDVIFPPEEGGSLAAQQERQTALTDGRATDERFQVRKDGSRFWASGLLMPLADRTAGFVKVLRDRSDRYLAEARLKASEERFRLLATNIPQLVFLSKSDGDRTWGSPQWIYFTGLTLEASLGFGWLEAIHPHDREATVAAWQQAQKDRYYYAEHRVRRGADGKYFWHQTRAKPIDAPVAGLPVDWIGTMTDVNELRGLQDRQQMLMAELEHRTRNLLTIVQSIARQTARSCDTIDAYMKEFLGRVQALGRVQTLVVTAQHREVDLRALIEAELSAHGARIDGHRVEILGAPLGLPFEAAQPIGLAIHELATNATKYGALCHENGILQIRWRSEQGAEPRIVLDWLESGFSPAPARGRKGYGTELIERALPHQLGAQTRLEITKDGVHCEIIVPLRDRHTG